VGIPKVPQAWTLQRRYSAVNTRVVRRSLVFLAFFVNVRRTFAQITEQQKYISVLLIFRKSIRRIYSNI
jgi:hypothetical protein